MSIKKLILTCLVSFVVVFNLFAQDDTSETEFDFGSVKTKIFPVIKVINTTSADTIDSKGNLLIYQKVVGDLYCFFGVDDGKQFVLISHNDLPEFINLNMLEEIARQNLLRETKNNMQIHKSHFGGGIGLDCGNRLEASLVTLSSTFKMMKERVGDNLVFAVPAEDLIIFVNGDNEWEIKELLKSIQEIHKAGERLLSQKLYVYRNGQVEEK